MQIEAFKVTKAEKEPPYSLIQIVCMGDKAWAIRQETEIGNRTDTETETESETEQEIQR